LCQNNASNSAIRSGFANDPLTDLDESLDPEFKPNTGSTLLSGTATCFRPKIKMAARRNGQP